MAIIAKNVAVDIAKTMGAAKAITSITKASPPVVALSAHGYVNGDFIVLTGMAGMVELEGQAVRVANVSANSFELEGFDSTSFGTFTAGSVQNVTAWDRLGVAQTISAADSETPREDVTTLLDTSKQYDFGLPDSPQITVNCLVSPFDPAVLNLKKAAKGSTDRVVRAKFQDKALTFLFNGTVSGGSGFDASAGSALKNAFRFQQKKENVWYLN